MAAEKDAKDVRLAVVRLNLSVPEHARLYEIYQSVDTFKRGEWVRYHLLRSALDGPEHGGANAAAGGFSTASATPVAAPAPKQDAPRKPPMADFLKND